MLLYFLRSGVSLVTLLEVSIFLVSLVLAITVHEFAHALMAEKLGDPTPKMLGRLTINPKSHLDPIGTLMMLFTGFGWGKPVPYNPFNLENPSRDSALISFAGPVSNIITAFIFALPIRLNLPFLTNQLLFELFLTAISLNIGLAVFNLIPIFPLDGFRVVGGILPNSIARGWETLAPYGTMFLLFLVLLPSSFSLIGLFVVPVSQTLLRIILGNPAPIF